MLAGFEERRAAFSELGASLYAAAVDSEEDSRKVAADLGFPIAYGVTREQANTLGAWWDDRRQFIQPSEFLLNQNGRILGSAYSSSPLGRMDPGETLAFVTMLDAAQKRKANAER